MLRSLSIAALAVILPAFAAGQESSPVATGPTAVSSRDEPQPFPQMVPARTFFYH
jgi:hypothetical protein